jgi:Gpi18-like mannosyltransferase
MKFMERCRKNKAMLLNTTLFAIFSAFLLLFLQWGGHDIMPFDTVDYVKNSHHFLAGSDLEQDFAQRTNDFDLTTALEVYDSNFYLFMGEELSNHGGWQNDPENVRDVSSMAFAFAPVYPLVLAFGNLFINNIFLTAFILQIILAILAFAVVFFVIEKWKGTKVATFATWLLVLSPPGIFLHLYFSESLALILIALLIYAFLNKRYLLASILVGLLIVTRFQALILLPLVFGILFKRWRKDVCAVKTLVLGTLFMILPFLFWVLFVWLNTGDPLFFLTIRSQWLAIPLAPLAIPIGWIMGEIPFYLHQFSFSLVDLAFIVGAGLLLIFSRHKLPPPIWATSLALWVLPLIVSGSMSNMRYSLILIPLYVFLAEKIKWPVFHVVLLTALALLQFWLMSYATNYYWMG